jgi:hypothetical protein
LGNIDHIYEEGLRMNVVEASAYYIFNQSKWLAPSTSA